MIKVEGCRMAPMYLYLRPFESDGQIWVDNPRKKSIWNYLLITYQVATPSAVNLEEALLQSVEKHGLLVSIGEQTKIIGAGRVIASDNDWRANFVALAHRAAYIFSVPSLHTSTIWELEWLAKSAMHAKVAMFFTPMHQESFPAGPAGVDPKSKFGIGDLRNKLIALGWSIPSSVKKGSIVNFYNDGTVKTHIENSSFKRKYIDLILKSV
ncbi:hypothetical protein [Pseudomonas sp. BF-R-12]|uniref:hypothetical protein n=1 Tax=Pseudomonas sp. BF-R-12 TaxID=2832363 RepID=UPI001CBD98DF|nr:hypothetical protein [Pseudomonas sp. BF-R-12]